MRWIYINPVQYPAVPKRLARIRMSLTSGHTKKQLGRVLEALDYLGDKYAIKTQVGEKYGIVS